ncbi:MAG: regulatory protein GemA [Sulfurimicrobium sp.]|nr:regulatory protein GemA [Sulfurimicrobium sp.]MDZ7656289.1 regulatory protein GemA [Sulfurimicrobium sp.]
MSARLIQLIKIGQKRLGWDDAIYRAWLEKHTGKRSAKNCSEAELSALADEMRDMGALDMPGGATPVPGGSGPDRPTQRQWRAALGLSKKLGMTGKPDDPAFVTFCKKITKLENPRFLDSKGVSALILALENWHAWRKAHPKEKEIAR